MGETLRVGDKVEVRRKTGHNGPTELVKGTITRFPEVIQIQGEKTAMIKYDDNDDEYPHKLFSIVKL